MLDRSRWSVLCAVALLGGVSGCGSGDRPLPATPETGELPDGPGRNNDDGDFNNRDRRAGEGPPVPVAGTDADDPARARVGVWLRFDASALGDGAARVVPLGRDVWIVGTRGVLRLDPAGGQVAAPVAGPARALAGATVVVTPGAQRLLAWGVGGGVRYDAATDGLATISRVGAPEVTRDPVAVWTGNTLLVWGGQSPEGRSSFGAEYIPENDVWIPLPTEGAPEGRVGAASAWTGHQLLVFGGLLAGDVVAGDGAVYSRSVRRWTPMSQDGAPAPRTHATGVWTGSEFIVWGGRDDDTVFGDGAAYDPLARRWRPIAAGGAPAPRFGHVAVWTGRHVLVWGGADAEGERSDGGFYDPVANQWIPIPADDAPPGRRDAAAAWTGRELVIAGGTRGGVPVSDVLVFRPIDELQPR